MSDLLLPLFPLQVVLFPGAALPLHIFEERYKVLVKDCLSGEKEFGVNLLNGTDVKPVGCTAAILSVLRMYDDGKMDIVIEGRRRFRVTEFHNTEAPYLLGAVEFLPESSSDVDPALREKTVVLYNQVIAAAFKGRLDTLEEGTTTPGLSFIMAQKAGMELEERQQLLELNEENERLHLLYKYFHTLLPRLQKAEVVERLVRNDGYLINGKPSSEAS